MKKANLKLIRLDILKHAKKHALFGGWNDNIFSSIAKKSKYTEEEIRILFPDGFKALLNFYLIYSDRKMTEACNNIDLITMKIHKRIRKIILLKLKVLEKEKDLVRRTFFTLVLPQNSSIAILSLYRTVDQIWYLAGDNSTDFNFYTKRAILAGIYSSIIFYWVNNNKTIDQTSKFLDKQLQNVSKISNIKKDIKSTFDLGSKIFSFTQNFSIKQ